MENEPRFSDIKRSVVYHFLGIYSGISIIIASGLKLEYS